MALDSLKDFRMGICFVPKCHGVPKSGLVWQDGAFIEICDRHFDIVNELWIPYRAKDVIIQRTFTDDTLALRDKFMQEVRQIEDK